jgi:hypothetical protein
VVRGEKTAILSKRLSDLPRITLPFISGRVKIQP